MTLSICVRDSITGRDGNEITKFGVAATTRLPSVGSLCPFTSMNGAVAVQGQTNLELGNTILAELDAGRTITDVIPELLSELDYREEMQVHGVDMDGQYVFTGDECVVEAGHESGTAVTVAGNGMASADVVPATAGAFFNATSESESLAEQLINALDAGHAIDEANRDVLPVQSAVVDLALHHPNMKVTSNPMHSLRVDASENPIADLRETYRTAVRGLNEYQQLKSTGDHPIDP